MSVADTVKILIVEDEVLIAEYVKELLEDDGFTNTKLAHDRDEAMMFFRSFCPEVILMDININGRDMGIELAAQKNPGADVIFLTAQNDLATMQKALATNPQSYLTKPVRKTDLMAAIQLVLQKRKDRFLNIKDGYGIIKIAQEDILYIKADNVYLDIHTSKKTYTIRQTLEKFMLELDPSLFGKTHRSYVVNRAAVTRVSSKAIYINSLEIPLSRNFSTNF
ncbi:response regulator transcription factor [Flavobacterium sp. MFBS3-15]|uniref:LytR/AlgR family response regulator transcription factor n=1 Tax=Flavobacterium sp. MFBS3-15 TaxID=2989816 RepID=UPI0022368051|nr:response regulator transcription factor [Flavobacterium sp. MFBS3-15]MCW4468794.1 response regulator transcription factor [Flavobacterium sp. MFBS3-15]